SNQGPAVDALIHLPATGRNGAPTPLTPFLGLPIIAQGSVPAPIPTASEMALFATDSLTIGSRLPLKGDIWCHGGIRLNARSPHVLTGNVTSGNGIRVTGDSLFVVGNMLCRGDIQYSPTMFVDGVLADNAELFAPMVMPALPTVPSVTFRADTVSVP